MGDENVLRLPPRSMIVFIDETGNEDLSDPKNPTFGRGGCGVLFPDYKNIIAKPWRRLKRERLGGTNRPFHATEFEQTRPTNYQISGINSFLSLRFWRFAAMCDSRTQLPLGLDAHAAISLMTLSYLQKELARYDVDVLALVFERSERGDSLVKRDFNLSQAAFRNVRGQPIELEGCFMEKSQMEPGLEVADLVAHTAGRMRRHQLRGGSDVLKDFEQMYWHSPIPPEFIAMTSIEISEEAKAGADLLNGKK
ncbi:hypothetical protein GCM10007874_11450 [Labrys miyagiensis]|uniref:DUF3800 domain-containing protein n=1 Tax=Labrys miyagiensis TaxID=346912 RepID=A0ABQ6CD59_9HYPH|nr:DUF3800 domain-containing protein [Labrys miyagiensis]GLS18129.1 hypothetical protein GCM10007874_11450 [Labrys miyagiensis]